MTLSEAKKQFRKEHPNLRVNGWDERDYELLSQLNQLSSYGLVAGDQDNPMLARKDVIHLLERNAEARFTILHVHTPKLQLPEDSGETWQNVPEGK